MNANKRKNELRRHRRRRSGPAEIEVLLRDTIRTIFSDAIGRDAIIRRFVGRQRLLDFVKGGWSA